MTHGIAGTPTHILANYDVTRSVRVQKFRGQQQLAPPFPLFWIHYWWCVAMYLLYLLFCVSKSPTQVLLPLCDVPDSHI